MTHVQFKNICFHQPVGTRFAYYDFTDRAGYERRIIVELDDLSGTDCASIFIAENVRIEVPLTALMERTYIHAAERDTGKK